MDNVSPFMFSRDSRSAGGLGSKFRAGGLAAVCSRLRLDRIFAAFGDQARKCVRNGPAFSPETNLIFVNSIDWCSTVKLDTKPPVFEPGKQFLGSADAFGEKDERKKGWVTAIDADTGVIRWRHETPAPMVAGIAVTATGIVFTAGLDGDLIALDATTGKVLRRVPTQQPAGGGVVTYQAGGKQRVAVATGLENNILQTKGEPVIIVYGL